jgi:hypothetical protein
MFESLVLWTAKRLKLDRTAGCGLGLRTFRIEEISPSTGCTQFSAKLVRLKGTPCKYLQNAPKNVKKNQDSTELLKIY